MGPHQEWPSVYEPGSWPHFMQNRKIKCSTLLQISNRFKWYLITLHLFNLNAHCIDISTKHFIQRKLTGAIFLFSRVFQGVRNLKTKRVSSMIIFFSTNQYVKIFRTKWYTTHVALINISWKMGATKSLRDSRISRKIPFSDHMKCCTPYFHNNQKNFIWRFTVMHLVYKWPHFLKVSNYIGFLWLIDIID